MYHSIVPDYIRSMMGALFYIYKNAVHHGYTKEISAWPWSSYKAIITTGTTRVLRNKIIEWFGSVEQFVEFNKQPVYLKTTIIIE